MGRNFVSVCDFCKTQLFHLRGEESDNMQRFADDHYAHKEHTRVLDDYVEEPPEDYTDAFDDYNPEFEKKVKSASANADSPIKEKK